MLAYSTPTQAIHHRVLDQAGVKLLVKREDLNHPLVSGNKWWKLKYNLQEAKELNHTTLLTFGGAYSNHIFATAAAAHKLGFKSIGIIRGEETLPLNKTLSFARQQGMKLHYVSRDGYRNKNQEGFINQLHDWHGEFYLIPEGGTNKLAVQGVTEFAKTLGHDFDYLCCPVGTGGTLAGLINGLPNNKTILGFSSLKGGSFLRDEIEPWLTNPSPNWEIITDYHFGGYGKFTNNLMDFQKQLHANHQLPLDLIYGTKMMFGIFDLVQKGFFKPGSVILALHTGGLQNTLL